MTSRGAYRNTPPASLPKTMGGRIRRIRVAWGWTQGQLAEQLNTDQQIISSWERDLAKPSRSSTALLARFFGIPALALETGTGFSVPDLPRTLHAGSGSDLPCSLPWIEGGQAASVPLHQGSARVLLRDEASELVRKLMGSGHRVWIVHDNPSISPSDGAPPPKSRKEQG